MSPFAYMLVDVYPVVRPMLGMNVLVCVHQYVHMYACMYVRVCVIGMKPKHVYIKMFTMELEFF